jgi:hypothetical protein
MHNHFILFLLQKVGDAFEKEQPVDKMWMASFDKAVVDR